MPTSAAIIIRAVSGDAQALAAMIRAHNNQGGDHAFHRLTAILLCDPDPHPLATLTAVVMRKRSPERLIAAARRAAPAAITMVMRDDYADVRAQLLWRLPSFLKRVDAFTDPETIAACARLACAAGDATLASHVMIAMGADQWRTAPAALQAALLQTVITRSRQAACGGGAVWMALSDDERVMIVRTMEHDVESAVILMKCIGAAGWERLPDHARATLLHLACRQIEHAAEGVGAVWMALSDDERVMIARAAADDPIRVVRLMHHIGSAGWATMPVDAHATLWATIASDPMMTDFASAVWGALNTDERAMVLRSAVVDAFSSGEFIKTISAQEWQRLPPTDRAMLIQTVVSDPNITAQSVGAIWTALDHDERERLGNAAARDTFASATLMASIGAAGWSSLPQTTRDALVRAICDEPIQAAHGGGAVWSALTARERSRIVRAAAREPAAAIHLMRSVVAQDRPRLSQTERRRLIDSITSMPWRTAYAVGAIWSFLAEHERERIVQAAGKGVESAALLIEGFAAAGVAPSLSEIHDALVAIAHDPYAAARGVVALGPALDDAWRTRLLRMAFADCQNEASLAVAHELQQRGVWRPWMAAFSPDVDADDDLRAAWKAVVQHTPVSHAIRLLVRRASRR